MSEKVPVPAKGYAIVRRVARGETEGGLIVPASSDDNDRFYIVATSAVMFVGGQEHPHGAQVGDEVLCNGEMMAPSFFPKDHAVANLSTVPAWYPTTKELH